MVYSPILNIAINAARAAGDVIARAIMRLDIVNVMEKRPNDFVTDVDCRAEEKIIAIIQKAYPGHAILAEESGSLAGTEDYQWIIDPLDGTRNFIHGFPHCAVSIAIRHKNKIEHGVIYDPIRQELFVATRGEGAQLNEHRIRVSANKRLEQSLLGIGAFSGLAGEAPNRQALNVLLTKSVDLRWSGSAALDLAYVAAGRLDGVLVLGLHLWDIAAGILFIKEAGGLICDPDGGESYMESGNIVAANPVLLRQLLQALRQHHA